MMFHDMSTSIFFQSYDTPLLTTPTTNTTTPLTSSNTPLTAMNTPQTQS